MDFEWIEDILPFPIINRQSLQRADGLDTYSHEDFRQRFRITKEIFLYVLNRINDKLKREDLRNSPISPTLQLMATIRLLAGGTYQQISADLHGISQPSLSRILDSVLDAICGLRQEFICLPSDLNTVKQKFYQYGGFPGVIGCLDGTHVPIVKPSNHAQPEIFRCRKGFLSLNVQILCGPDHFIYNIVARWPGSTHDARIFSNSLLKDRLENNEIQGTILADGGYPCLRCLLTPLRNPITPEERRYNRCHIKTRNVVERTIGILKNRFRCLYHKLHYRPEKVGNIVVACAILHNLCLFFKDEWDYLPDPNPVNFDNMHVNNPAGNAHRQHLINNFFMQ
jgi:hypothetical protein